MNQNFKSGYIGIIGRPNVGKSTLMNALVGQKIAIISAKPQTTRGKILSIATDQDSQMIFLDTPGFHKPRTKLGESMVRAVNETIGDVDMLLMVAEPVEEIREAEREMVQKIGAIPAILIINKVDTVKKEALLPVLAAYSRLHSFLDIIPVSARTGDGLEQLKGLIKQHLPQGPMYYPEDMVTDQQEKQVVAEIIREKLLRLLNQEVPHGTAIEVVKMKELSDRDEISANIYCEKASHKGIIIGAGGKTLKQVGTLARVDCERLLGKKVYLELWVKVKPGWRNSESAMREIGLEH